MGDKKPFYITTTLPYVNSDPHIGFAMEIIRADVVARAKKLQGYEVFFNTGTDEHGQKIFDKARESGIDVQAYVDGYAQKFQDLRDSLDLSEDIHFVRTTDNHHIQAAQEFWKRCMEAGDIYKKKYQVKYCVGCELEKTDSELIEGRCIIHPQLEIQLIDEDNYFFRFSKYQQPLLDFYNTHPGFVVPDFRFNEIKAFVERGLEDFSISRLKSKMSWGIPVPGDDEQVMYVWFDALISYISTIGWPENTEEFEKFWKNGTPVQYCGKDNLRQQTAMWQAMLLSAKLPNTQTVVVNGFINSDGQKMSKSLGNVVNPNDLVSEYGTDALRYYVLREFSPFEDSDFTMTKFKEAYNANLANGLGNLVSRVMKMAQDNLEAPVQIPEWEDMIEYFSFIDSFEINKASDFVWGKIGEMDKYIQENQPFKVIKTDVQVGKRMISDLVISLYSVARMLNALLPETSIKIKTLIKENKSPETPLFIRKE